MFVRWFKDYIVLEDNFSNMFNSSILLNEPTREMRQPFLFNAFSCGHFLVVNRGEVWVQVECNHIFISVLTCIWEHCTCARFCMDRKQNSCSHMLNMTCFEAKAGNLVQIPTVMDKFLSLHPGFARIYSHLQGHPCVFFLLSIYYPDFLLEFYFLHKTSFHRNIGFSIQEKKKWKWTERLSSQLSTVCMNAKRHLPAKYHNWILPVNYM